MPKFFNFRIRKIISTYHLIKHQQYCNHQLQFELDVFQIPRLQQALICCDEIPPLHSGTSSQRSGDSIPHVGRKHKTIYHRKMTTKIITNFAENIGQYKWTIYYY